MSWHIITICDRCKTVKTIPWEERQSRKVYEEPGGAMEYTLCEGCAREYRLLHERLQAEMNDKKRKYLKGEEV